MVVESSLFFLGKKVIYGRSRDRSRGCSPNRPREGGALRVLITLLFGGFLVEISGDSPQALIGAVVLTAALWATTQD